MKFPQLPFELTPMKIMAALYVGAVVIDSISGSWGDKRPVGGFFEEMIARLVYFGVIAGTFAGGIWVGIKIDQRFENRLLSWASGIISALLISAVATVSALSIPGVGWRFERLQNSQSDME